MADIASAAAKPAVVIPQTSHVTPAPIVLPASGRLEGAKGEEALNAAFARVLGGEAAGAETPNGSAAGVQASGTVAGAAGGAPAKAGTPSLELPAFAALPAEELAEVTARAKDSGVTPEVQYEAEAEELGRLQAKATAEGKTIEEIVAAEEAAAGVGDGAPAKAGTPNPNEPKTFTQDQVEGLIQQRVGNLKAENQTLRQQLEEARAAGSGGSGPESGKTGGLDHIMDAGKLAEIRQAAEGGLATADRLLSLLNVNPQRVEGELRRLMGPEQAAAMEFTPEAMMDVLLDSKASLAGQLKAVPERERYLTEFNKAEQLVPKVHMFLADAADPRTVMFNRFAVGMPGIKASPTWKYWLGGAIQWHHEQVAKQAAAAKTPNSKLQTPSPAERSGATGRYVPKVKFPKSAAGGGRSAVPAGSRVAGVKAKLAGSRRTDEGLLEEAAVALFQSRP